jgi:transposase
MLKRAIAHEIYHTLTRPAPVPDSTDLRPAREARLLTLAVVADHFGVWPATISRLERRLLRDDTLADQYRAWLVTPDSPRPPHLGLPDDQPIPGRRPGRPG